MAVKKEKERYTSLTAVTELSDACPRHWLFKTPSQTCSLGINLIKLCFREMKKRIDNLGRII